MEDGRDREQDVEVYVGLGGFVRGGGGGTIVGV